MTVRWTVRAAEDRAPQRETDSRTGHQEKSTCKCKCFFQLYSRFTRVLLLSQLYSAVAE